jgi:CheY-like chemotaxis protein
MDMVLPGIDGVAATLLVKAAQATRHIPIIAISSNLSYHGLQQQLASVGVDVF